MDRRFKSNIHQIDLFERKNIKINAILLVYYNYVYYIYTILKDKAMKSYFDQFTEEQIKNQYKENYKGLVRMQTKAQTTGKKVNGYTLVQLNEMVTKYNILSE